jgi:hypothetical protein
MSDVTAGAPPIVPPVFPGTTFADEGGEPRGTVQVTRNVPPKRVMVNPGSTVTYAGVTYSGGDAFLIGEGPVADAWALAGVVTIVDHEQVAEWNGKEGREIAKRAHQHIAESGGGGEPTHDHGFGKYEHADGGEAPPSDITLYRQQAAADPRLAADLERRYGAGGGADQGGSE